MQAAAFHTLLSGGGESALLARAALLLAEAAGERGMCGGQYLDTDGGERGQSEESLRVLHSMKTGALLRAACLMGVAASMGRRAVDESCFNAARDYATNLGLAFQIRDDILDVIGDAAEFGKPIGSDASNEKTTYVTLLGTEECERRVLDYTEKAKAALDQGNWQGDTEFLRTLADVLAERRK